MISFNKFSKSYNDQLILSIEHLSMSPGIYWVRGENGSGKTTLFKSLAGLIPYEGEIEFIDGTNLTKHPVEFRRRVNYSEAEPLFPGFLTAKDLIRFIGKIKKASQAQQSYYAEKLGIQSFFEKPCDAYSSGMLKKLSLALVFLGNPRILILDEPLITLDDQTRLILLALIKEINMKSDVITLISSHQPIELSDVAITKSFEIRNKSLVEV